MSYSWKKKKKQQHIDKIEGKIRSHEAKIKSSNEVHLIHSILPGVERLNGSSKGFGIKLIRRRQKQNWFSNESTNDNRSFTIQKPIPISVL